MKNDVVRWSNKTEKQHRNFVKEISAFSCQTEQTQQQQSPQQNANSNCCTNEQKSGSNMLLPKSSSNCNTNTNSKCDNSYLVQSLTNNFANTCQQRHSTTSSNSRRRSTIANNVLLQVASCKTRALNNSSLENGSYKYSKSWQNYLTLSVVLVFLCNFNIGFALAEATSSAAKLSKTSNVELNELPYVLDYEDVAVAPQLEDASSSHSKHYTHTWAVHIPDGDKNETLVQQVAKDHGFVNLGKVSKNSLFFIYRKKYKISLKTTAKCF